jgi:predicted dehydrogenase
MTESKIYRVGLVGCGRIGTRTSEALKNVLPAGWLPLSHAEAICGNPRLQLVGLCDMDAGRLRNVAETYGIQHQYRDYRDLLSDLSVDILAVATRTEGRCEIIREAATQGVLGIHAEKPLGRNLKEVQLALNATRMNGVFLTYGTTRRFMDVYRKAKALVLEGVIGSLQEIIVEHDYTTLMWNHPHSVDLLLYFADCLDVDFVQALCGSPAMVRNAQQVDIDPIISNAFVQFSNGIRGVISGASGMNTRLSGTEGSLTIGADGAWLQWTRKQSSEQFYFTEHEFISVDPAKSGTQHAFESLITAIEEHNAPGISPDEIETGMWILLAVAYSAMVTGRSVSLGEIPPDFTVLGQSGALFA